MKMNYDKELKVAETAARNAGEILAYMFRKELTTTAKTGRDFLTEADKAAENEIIRTIRKSFPSHAIISEECGEKGNSGHRWIVDPLDGTHNFYYGIPLFGTMIAMEFDDDIVLSVIFLPCQNEMYKAVKGKGSFLNNKRIHVSKRRKMFMYFYKGMSDLYKNKTSQKLLEITAKKYSPMVRTTGCAAFDWGLIARGNADGSIVANGYPLWDAAPGVLLIKEASGKVTDVNGKEWTTRTKDFIVSNGNMHEELLKIARKLS